MAKTVYINHRLLTVALILQFIISSAFSQVKSTLQMKAELSKQNNPGQFANRFAYTTISGQKYQLYSVAAKYTLLFFYIPECEACK